MTTEIKKQKEFVIYQANDGSPKIEVRLENETIWLTNLQLTELFQTTKSNVSEHIKHIFEERELNYDSTVRKFRTVATNGKTYEMEHNNLDMIISLGYRINSRVATNFRIWATQRLKEYIVKGFTMDDERLKGNGYRYKLHYATHGHTAAEVIAERADVGKVSHEQAMEKAKAEYRKYQQKTLSDVEMAYLETIKAIEKSVKGKDRD